MLKNSISSNRSKMRRIINKLKLPWTAVENYRISKERKHAEYLLNNYSRVSDETFEGTVLLDAGWDNPNYWLRYSLLRCALGLHRTKEVGILGPFRRQEQKSTLERFGINEIFDITTPQPYGSENQQLAERLWQKVKSADDILKLELPFELPAAWLYDFILKKQRLATVDICDSDCIEHLRFLLNCLSAANEAIKQYKPKLVISSHAVSWFAALVWLALKNNIKAVVLFGGFGLIRFWQLHSTDEICDFLDRPSFTQFQHISDTQKNALGKTGQTLLESRFKGQSSDLGGMLSFQNRKRHITKAQICSRFKWNPEKKIIGVYASNWFDFPHFLGMSYFRDFNDWIMSVFEVAKENDKVNWLFKAHPCDDWYGGPTLVDIIDFFKYPHIKLAQKDWHGYSLLRSISGGLTYHGAAGVEFTAIEKPVMVADVGAYHDWKFVKTPASRNEYLHQLRLSWWEDMDLRQNAKLAQIFAGWYWGRPSWQKDFLLEDDSRQWEIYINIPNLLEINKNVISKEVKTIRQWFRTKSPHYHTYKMMQTDEYIS